MKRYSSIKTNLGLGLGFKKHHPLAFRQHYQVKTVITVNSRVSDRAGLTTNSRRPTDVSLDIIMMVDPR